MNILSLIQTNLLSGLVLAFILGVIAKLVKSDLSLPKDLYTSLSLYLLLALGLKGGYELAESSFGEIAWPAAATILLGVITPLSAFFLLNKIGKFSAIDSAGMAAHYGSVSAVTFMAAQQFVTNMGLTAEGFMPTLLTLLESPGIHIALAIGAFSRAKSNPQIQASWKSVLHEVLASRSMLLLVGGLIIGYLIGPKGYEPIQPFFEGGFKGALVLFLLEMGVVAASRLKDLRSVGGRLVAFSIIIPLLHGLLGALLGHWAGLSLGGTTILATMAASASYIAAPPAVQMTLPEANPTYYLTSSLAITFPFNLIIGIPVYFEVANFLQ